VSQCSFGGETTAVTVVVEVLVPSAGLNNSAFDTNAATIFAETSLAYCWNVVADGLGQRRVSVVVLGVNPPACKVQHSSSVEQ